jgi:hypothetical protein
VAKILLIPHGWLGDRLFTTSVGTVLKRYMDDVEIYFLSTPEFSYMDTVLESFASIDKVVTHEEASQIEFDYAFQMPHTDHSESPVKTFCRSILQVENFGELDFTPELITKDTLLNLNDFTTPFDNYITYQVDWQQRTRLNVDYIINKLKERCVNCVPIGKYGLSNQGDPKENRTFFHQTLTTIAHANYHISMLGGTAVMATYVNTPTIVSMDHYYYKHNEHNYPVDKFMEWWGLWPNTIAQTNIHHMFHPFQTEDDIIQYTIQRIEEL